MARIDTIVPFRAKSKDRLTSAIARFDANENSPELLSQFVELLDEGEAEASYFIGVFYEDGLGGVRSDPSKAFSCYKQAAEELGYIDGWLAVARMKYYGRGVARDLESAYSIYARLSECANNAIACYRRGYMLHHGEGAAKDLAGALTWYRRGAALGNVYAMVGLSAYYATRGAWLLFIRWRVQAALTGMRIGWRDPKDNRLRSS